MSSSVLVAQLQSELKRLRESERFWGRQTDPGLAGFSIAEHRERIAAEIVQREQAVAILLGRRL